MAEKQTIYLHTGSNLGDRIAHLAKACEMIEKQIGKISNQSRLYETEAWGMKDQPDFINQALEVQTELIPEEILSHIKKIEKEIGREENKKWHERIIDIDILFHGDTILSTEKLKIPHPHCHERMFVLIPLMEIAGDFVHPTLNLTIEELYIDCKDPLEVYLLEEEE
ncbi:MAG: 2-amino-4-hydroxy-6-hydroxymethyldihydropteridine diphosphokinase [Saprospiraceae bacterium]